MKHILKVISILLASLTINGCMPKQADGTYPTTYSYHPYNKNPHVASSPKNRNNQEAKNIEEQPWIQSNALTPQADSIINLALKQKGKPYLWAAMGPDQFDCSGFTTFVYKKNGIPLPRTAKAQAKVGERVDYNHLKEGDLIFFRSKNSSTISHTGIYLGQNQFIHASSAKNKVIKSRLDHGYYRENFQWGRRFFK